MAEDTFRDQIENFFFGNIKEQQRDLTEEVQELQVIKEELDPEKQKEKFEEFFQVKLKYLQQEFPDLFGPAIAKAIDHQIKNSKEEIINALYPIMGKLIRKYVQSELEALSKRIDDQLDRTFSFEHIKMRIKAFFSKASYEELVIQSMSPVSLAEIFIVDSKSGLLHASHSYTQLLNPDMVAGMLTGIVDFMQHAFNKEKQGLNMIDYDEYDIFVYNYRSYYVACLIEGIPHKAFKDRLGKSIEDFCEQHTFEENHTQAYKDKITTALKNHFYGFNEINNTEDSATGESRSGEDLPDQPLRAGEVS